MLSQFIEANAPLFHELGIVEILLNDYVNHRERQSRIAARSNSKPQIRSLCRLGPNWINDKKFGPLLLRLRDQLPINGKRPRWIAAPKHDTAALVVVPVQTAGQISPKYGVVTQEGP